MDVITAMKAIDPSLVLMALAGSPLIGWARDAGLTVVAEAFADRGYTASGALVSRREPGAVLHDVNLIADRMLTLARDGVIEAVDGSLVHISADSICVHGDSPGAVSIAQHLRERFVQEGVKITSFVA